MTIFKKKNNILDAKKEHLKPGCLVEIKERYSKFTSQNFGIGIIGREATKEDLKRSLIDPGEFAAWYLVLFAEHHDLFEASWLKVVKPSTK